MQGGPDSLRVPSEARPFDALGAIVGVIIRPAAALADVAAARPWRVGVALIVSYALLTDLANLLVPWTPTDWTTLPVGYRDVFAQVGAFLHSPTWMLAVVIVSPVTSLVYTALCRAIGQRLGGQGRFDALFAALAPASVPGILGIPIDAMLTAPGNALGPIPALTSDAFALWGLVLDVLAIRAVLALSTARAIATWLILNGLLTVLAVGTVVYFAGRAASALLPR